MKGHLAAVLTVFCSALTCGATFLLALYRQLALVEVAACIVLGVELYFLSSTIGDWIETKMEPSKTRKWIAMGLAGAVVCYFLIARLWNRSVAG
ncbi:MAG TPA: hypothetical protein VMH20_06220 [Verrucomicrobiae bacterium]|jgi:hypothetical protein|nr:hypothetical protein [Verrucomicrobiae bacterium]